MTAVELLMKYENQWVYLSKEQIDYMLDENLPPLAQTEISDEEIEKVSNTLGDDYYASELIMWEKGAKWYREQISSKADKIQK